MSNMDVPKVLRRRMPVRMDELVAGFTNTSANTKSPSFVVPNSNVPKKKCPVRLFDLIPNRAPSSRRSTVAAWSPQKDNEQEPRLVRRNIGIIYEHQNPITQSSKEQIIRQQQLPVKRQQQALQRPKDIFEDLNTTHGIQPLTSPYVSIGEPTEKRRRTIQPPREKTVTRGVNLRELAMQNTKRRNQKIDIGESSASKLIPIKTHIPIPKSPNIKELGSSKPAAGIQLRNKTTVQNRSAHKSCTITREHQTEMETASSSAASNFQTVVEPVCNEELKENQQPTLKCSVIMQKFDFAEQESNGNNKSKNSCHAPSNLENCTELTPLTENTTSPIHHTSSERKQILPVEENIILTADVNFTTKNPNCNAIELQLNELEKKLTINANYQKRCQNELNVVYNKQLEIETELQRLKYQHNVVYNKRFELEQEMQNLTSKYGENQNEFMRLCRSVARLGVQSNEVETVQPTGHITNLLTMEPIVEMIAESKSISHTDSSQIKSSGESSENKIEETNVSLLTACSRKSVKTSGALTTISTLNASNFNPDDHVNNSELEENTKTETTIQIAPIPPEIRINSLTPRRSLRILSQSNLVNSNSYKSTEKITTPKESQIKTKRLSKSSDIKSHQDSLENSSNPKKEGECQVILSEEIPLEVDNTSENVLAIEPSNFYSGMKNPHFFNTTLRRSRTFVLEKPSNTTVGSESCEKSDGKDRRSVVDYRLLQASFHGLLQTPMKTPVHKSAKKQSLCPMDTPSNISRRVQASLEFLLDTSN